MFGAHIILTLNRLLLILKAEFPETTLHYNFNPFIYIGLLVIIEKLN